MHFQRLNPTSKGPKPTEPEGALQGSRELRAPPPLRSDHLRTVHGIFQGTDSASGQWHQPL